MAKQSKSGSSSSHLTDDPRQAVESGDPQIAGRVPGHPTSPSRSRENKSTSPSEEFDEHYESGRQEAIR